MSLISELLTAVASLANGQRVFAQSMPTSPVVATCVILTGGPFDPSNPTRNPTFQVVHRNTNVESGATFVTSLHAGLSNAWNTLPSINARIVATSEPGGYVFIGDRNALYSLNFRVVSTRPY